MRTFLRLIGFAVALLALAFFSTARAATADPAKEVPLFEGTGAYTRAITGASALGQRYFDQGVAFITNFNHDEGLRLMQRATQLDPECAMAWWGVALACSPHINATGVSAERAQLAWEALATAEKYSAPCTAAERALIGAMKVRFSRDPKAPRRPLDEAFVVAMREAWQAHPTDADIGTMLADAMMMLRPWDLWQKDGAPQPGTEELLTALDAALKINPRHPLANHLAVHANEASAHPERGEAAADMLRELTPGLGHMVHMSSHIYVRCGRWEDAIVANQRAIAVDLRYREVVGQPLSGYLNYMGHDYHMLCYAAMMSGQGELAARIMRDLFAHMPAEWGRDSTIGDGYFSMHYEVMKRFGKWEQILAEPEPLEKYFHARAWRYLVRGIALAAKGDPVGARAEEKAFLAACGKVPAGAVYRKNPLPDILAIGAKLLDGEILIREGKLEPALAALREAIVAEDKLRYAEPPAWAQPVRQALGAALMERGRFVEAEEVYRADLARYADNGWSLYGLGRALRLQKKNPDEATAVEARFKKVWAKADLELTSSCLCQPGT